MSSTKKLTDMGHPEYDALWSYTSLLEPALSSELTRLSSAQSVKDTDLVTFQPCPNPDYFNQDRYAVHSWVFPSGTWSFRAIFDGHAGHETVDHTVTNLPNLIQEALAILLKDKPTPEPQAVSKLLADTTVAFDKAIEESLLGLFPDVGALARMSDDQIKDVLEKNPDSTETILRCIRGTTVLIALTDPSKANLWVASLGDCAAVLGTKSANNTWGARVLSHAHNGDNPAETDRVKKEHPGEPTVVLDNRVLGAIAVTRAIGDFSFKLPATYTHRIFLSKPGYHGQLDERVRQFTARNHTPPYLSAVAEVEHVDLTSLGSAEKFIVMCSDGLMDLYENDRLKLNEVLASRWVNIIGENYDQNSGNLALGLLRHALGGTDNEEVSRMITVEMLFRWMDDTTILVQKL